MKKKNANFSEIKTLNLNGFKYLKSKKSIDFKFMLSILILKLNLIFFFIIIYFIYIVFGLKKIINNKLFVIKKNEKNEGKELNFKNKISNEKLNSIKKKLKTIKKNQKIYQNKHNIYNLLISMEVLGLKKVRIGRKADGGYIFLDDFKNIKIAYSFGISKEISFEKELADKNIDVFMYDHLINFLPFENSRFHWKKIGLEGINTNNTNLKTLPELLKENGHSEENNMILKLDIESHEWKVFLNLPLNILNKFKYIVGEFHFYKRKKFYYYNILKKIQITHKIFHLHCNNCGRIIDLEGYKICNLLEISFVQKNSYKFTKSNNKFPIKGLDFKNCEKKREISSILNLFLK